MRSGKAHAAGDGARRARLLRAAALLVGGLLATRGSSATEIELSLDAAVSYGDPVILEAKVVDPKGSQVPELSPVTGLRIKGPYAGGTTDETISDGRRTVHTVSQKWRWKITPEAGRNGTFELGPVTLATAGKPAVRSNRVRLTVARRPGLGLGLTVSLSSTGGEILVPFRVTYTLTYPRDALDSSSLQGLGVSFPLLDSTGATVKPVSAGTGGRAYRLSLRDREDRTVLFEETSVRKADGTAYSGLAFAFEVTPMTPGKLVIPEASASMPLRTGEVKDAFDFFRGRVRVPTTRRFGAKSREVSYSVRPLPEAGRPPGFTGAIGRFRITVSTKDTAVSAFDPIALEVKVTGQGRLETLALPAWSRFEELTRNFDVSTDVDTGRVEDKAKIFRQTIRPRSASVRKIPSLPFPYYDPWKHAYAVARSAPIAIQVRPARTVGADESYRKPVAAPAASTTARSSAVTASPILEVTGIPANFRDRGVPEGSYQDPRAVLTSPLFLSSLALPPLLFALLLLALTRARLDPREKARRGAHTAARAALRRAGDDREAVCAAYQEYFRARFRLPAGELTPSQLRELLSEHANGAEISHRAAELLERLLAGRFGGGGMPAAEEAREAERTIASIESSRVGKR